MSPFSPVPESIAVLFGLAVVIWAVVLLARRPPVAPSRYAIRVWWAWQWRTFVLTVLVAAVTGLFMVMGKRFGAPPEDVKSFGEVVAFWGHLAACVYAMRIVLNKEFKTFGLVVQPKLP